MTKTDYTGRDFGNLEGEVRTVTKLMFAIIPLIIGLGGGLFWFINDTKTSLTGKIEELGTRLTKIETSINSKLETSFSDLRRAEDNFAAATAGSLARIEDRIAAAGRGQSAPILLISSDDARAIRNAVEGKFDPTIAYPTQAKLGDIVSNTKLFNFPENLISKYPLLRGTHYAFDVKNQLLIVSDSDQRIVAVV